MINVLGEKLDTEEQTNWFAGQYETILEGINKRKLNAGISLKLTSIGLLNDGLAERNLEYILERGDETDIEVDMESRNFVEKIIEIAEKMLGKGYKFRIAMQSALKSAYNYTKGLKECAEANGGDISFRICTGSCYGKNENGYETTLELSEKETDEQFYKLMDLAGKGSAVGTGKIERALYAKKEGMEVQSLKGDENTEVGKIADTFYVCFGDWRTNEGVRKYILRRGN